MNWQPMPRNTQIYRPLGGTDHGRGWPWEYCSWSIGWIKGTPNAKWNYAALAGDAVVFVTTVALVFVFARRWTRFPRWSTGNLTIFLTAGCIVCAWIGYNYRQSKAHDLLADELGAIDVEVDDKYADPRWIARLAGRNGSFNGLFYRIDDFLDLRFHPKERERFLELLARHPGIRGLIIFDVVAHIQEDELSDSSDWARFHDENLRAMLQSPCLRGLKNLDLSSSALGDDALLEIGRNSELESIDLSRNAGDRSIELLTACPNLRVLNARGTQITGKSLSSFRRMPALKVLDLRETNVPADQRPAFEELPLETIRWE
jgi:hypothetical protein